MTFKKTETQIIPILYGISTPPIKSAHPPIKKELPLGRSLKTTKSKPDQYIYFVKDEPK
ncbi:MAG: hypothetical protein OXH36_02955 [Bdellovibrionales bacterium]|nr:hypothetical protein [Bdellovibrionales bacterium]